MPIFRIMGGGNSSSSNSSGGNNASSASGASPSPSSSSTASSLPRGRTNQFQQQSQSQQQSRYTYPGQRAGGGISSHTSFLNNPAYSSGNNNPGVVIRGSHVHSSSLLSSSSSSSSSSTMMTTTTPAGLANAANPSPSGMAATPTSPATGEGAHPGAYAVTRVSTGPAQVFRVTVPAGVQPGSEFSVHAGNRRVRVRCPPTSRPGQSLQITLPPEPITSSTYLKVAPLTASTGQDAGGGASAMTPEVREVNRAATAKGGTAQTFLVTIPPNVYPGMPFDVSVEGQKFRVTCPPNAGPNMKVRIVPPTKSEEPTAAPKTQVFEVVVPQGVRPGQPFTLMANDQRVLVTCPANVGPGEKIRFQLPVNQQQMMSNIKLSYEGNAWQRTIRVSDLKFQWVRMQGDQVVSDADGTGEGSDKMDFKTAAYVRKLTFLEGNDARMRTGTLDLVPAQEAVVDSKLVFNNKTLLSYEDIASVQGKTLDEKTLWFRDLCDQLIIPWDDGHIKIVVRRSVLLHDSVDAVMSLGRDDLRKRWRLEFMGEPGIDAGGLMREWFQLVSGQIFDPDKGLWLSSAANQMCMTINPASSISCPDDHLVYFRFLGRVMGRALFDQQLITGHMVRHYYKHLLGWPITFQDLELDDEDYYQSLKKLSKMDDVSIMCLDFTATEERMGTHTEVELVEGGAMKEVTNANLAEYLEANLKYRMLARTRPQLTELLLGFFDVIPEALLTVFDHQELELVLCGLPRIDMGDWENNTIYSGLFETKGSRHEVVCWFWEVVRDDFDQEMKARLLQFVTGTSGVPSRGFSVLQGNDGNIKKFAIHGVDTGSYKYPKAHTCFNRIDLPTYSSKKELAENLKVAVTTSAVGFGIE